MADLIWRNPPIEQMQDLVDYSVRSARDHGVEAGEEAAQTTAFLTVLWCAGMGINFFDGEKITRAYKGVYHLLWADYWAGMR